MYNPDDDRFDDRDLLELIQLAAYLEGKSGRGQFPRARFRRYSDTLERLVAFLVEVGGTEISEEAGRFVEWLSTQQPPSSAKILTHPRFHKRKPK